MIKLSCIKCKKLYDTNDTEPYYCQECNEERLKIAREVDKKFERRQDKNIKSDLQIFDEIAHAKGGKGNNFVNIKDLGITL